MSEKFSEVEQCEKCGQEIRGEVCPHCYTAEDQSFDSYTPAENATRLSLIGFGIGLLAITYFVSSFAYPNDSWILSASKWFSIFAVYAFYMAGLYILAAIGKISVKRVKELDPVRKYLGYLLAKRK